MDEMASIGGGTIPTGPESVAIKPDGKFKGTPYFNCSQDTFSKCVNGKKKYKKWDSFLGKNDYSKTVKSWMKQSSTNKNFIIRNDGTGEMIFSRSSGS